MNQTAIGSYIARKRKEQNLTQEQLAQQLGVSNKTISNGRTESVCRITALFRSAAKRFM